MWRVCRTYLLQQSINCNKILMRNMKIKVFPNEPLVDEKLLITISGLKPSQEVTVKFSLTEAKSCFSSSACFTATSKGDVHIHKQPSELGTYIGIDSMGLFWSMKADPGQEPGQRYFKRDITTPQLVQISVYNGYHSWEACHNLTITPIFSHELERWFMSKTVTRKEIRHGNLRGSLFIPQGSGPFRGVIDMFGTAGGLIEFRAALLASRGFIAYALPYFAFEDLPKEWTEINFDYLKETVDWFSSHPNVAKDGIGMIGVSKGGEIAMMLATKCPQIKAVVNINGPPFCSSYPLGPFTDVVEMDLEGMVFKEEGMYMKNIYSKSFTADKILKVWESNAKILYIVGEDDQSVDPNFAQVLLDCYPQEHRHKLIIQRYDNAGHLIEPPYNPICHVSYHKVFRTVFVWGGRTEEHAKAQADSWPKILAFLISALRNTTDTLYSHL